MHLFPLCFHRSLIFKIIINSIRILFGIIMYSIFCNLWFLLYYCYWFWYWLFWYWYFIFWFFFYGFTKTPFLWFFFYGFTKTSFTFLFWFFFFVYGYIKVCVGSYLNHNQDIAQLFFIYLLF